MDETGDVVVVVKRVKKKPDAEWRRRPRGVKSTAGSVLVFCGKLAALEVLRRTTQARCRLVWWAVQGLAVAGAPGLGWLRRFAPLRAVADASESFSKPMIFLSLTTVVASAYHEAKTSGSVSEKVPRSVVETGTCEIEEEVVVVDKQASSDALMREELKKHGVVLPERVGDDEVKRFWLASKGDTAKFVSTVRKTQEWRQSYDFMARGELREWSHLVFWHLRDFEGRPVLVIRLGLACTTLAPAQRPQFARAVISQVEYGVQHLLSTDDPRLTVVTDCRGTTAFGFPVKMLKSCVALVQEHYPMRLATFYLVNAPPLVRAVANAIIQVLKPATREKVRIEGEKYVEVLAKAFGAVPAVLAGTCSCATCIAVEEKEKTTTTVSLMETLAEAEKEIFPEERMRHATPLSVRNPHSQVIRVIILGLVCLWIVIAMLSGRS